MYVCRLLDEYFMWLHTLLSHYQSWANLLVTKSHLSTCSLCLPCPDWPASRILVSDWWNNNNWENFISLSGESSGLPLMAAVSPVLGWLLLLRVCPLIAFILSRNNVLSSFLDNIKNHCLGKWIFWNLYS